MSQSLKAELVRVLGSNSPDDAAQEIRAALVDASTEAGQPVREYIEFCEELENLMMTEADAAREMEDS